MALAGRPAGRPSAALARSIVSAAWPTEVEKRRERRREEGRAIMLFLDSCPHSRSLLLSFLRLSVRPRASDRALTIGLSRPLSLSVCLSVCSADLSVRPNFVGLAVRLVCLVVLRGSRIYSSASSDRRPSQPASSPSMTNGPDGRSVAMDFGQSTRTRTTVCRRPKRAVLASVIQYSNRGTN